MLVLVIWVLLALAPVDFMKLELFLLVLDAILLFKHFITLKEFARAAKHMCQDPKIYTTNLLPMRHLSPLDIGHDWNERYDYRMHVPSIS